MALSPQVVSKSACSHCRNWLFQSFLSLARPSRPLACRPRRSFTTHCNAARRESHRPSVSSYYKSQSRTGDLNTDHNGHHYSRGGLLVSHFATIPDSKTTESPVQDGELEQNDEEVLVSEKSAQDGQEQDYVPWYLRGSSTSPASAQHTLPGQDMPTLPEHSPKLLQPIVTHVLETLGLSFLDVLDLRTITDPPPALGSNLIMVVATARSERHLHASADRLCRWLRSEYKLTPVADGLLGRNEMKIAVRRRIKRAKMMSAVGAGSGAEGDVADGIRSSWICVNVGRVEGGVLPEEEELHNRRKIVGFGGISKTCTVVVQMMTESKREELDLASLWTATKKRQDRQRQAIGEADTDINGSDDIDMIWSTPSAPPQRSTEPGALSTYEPHHGSRSTSTVF